MINGRKVNEAVVKVTEMIFKEENILFPMVLETFSEDEWLKIAEECGEIGYCLTKPQANWKPVNINVMNIFLKSPIRAIKSPAVIFPRFVLHNLPALHVIPLVIGLAHGERFAGQNAI